jgi:hypothetical protein
MLEAEARAGLANSAHPNNTDINTFGTLPMINNTTSNKG